MATVSIYETMSLEQMQHDMYFVWETRKTQPAVLWDSQCHRLAGLPRHTSVSVRSAIMMCTKVRVLMASQIYWVCDCLIRNKTKKEKDYVNICKPGRQTTEWNTLEKKNEPILHCVQLWPLTKTFCKVALWAGCGHSRTFQPGLPFMFLLSRPLLALFWSFLADHGSHRKH